MRDSHYQKHGENPPIFPLFITAATLFRHSQGGEAVYGPCCKLARCGSSEYAMFKPSQTNPPLLSDTPPSHSDELIASKDALTSLDSLMDRVVFAASSGTLLPISLDSELPPFSSCAFSAEKANALVFDAFLRTTISRIPRDFRLLELIIPFLRGSFAHATKREGDEVRTLGLVEETEVDTPDQLSLSDQRFFQSYADAHSYLMRPTARRVLFAVLLPSGAWHSGTLGQLCTVPLCAAANAFTALAVKKIDRPSLRQAFQLRKLYELGILNLQENPGVFMPVGEFLQSEHRDSGR